MGRGRQKAKDAKIARQLKYTNHGSDIRELERELVAREEAAAAAGAATSAKASSSDDSDEYYDRWAEDED
ncbi:DUF3073 family protein [Demequina sp.]|uniref:DUF3073 family protein n=1 Tax=Demequina sp. TaxID=2050685 RepID=UPI0025CD12E2|nr:DUF3073 family protein [Demequina sp.]